MAFFHFHDLTPEQQASREYGFVQDDNAWTRTVNGVEQATAVYRKIPLEVTNLGRVLSWSREPYWGPE